MSLFQASVAVTQLVAFLGPSRSIKLDRSDANAVRKTNYHERLTLLGLRLAAIRGILTFLGLGLSLQVISLEMWTSFKGAAYSQGACREISYGIELCTLKRRALIAT